MKKLLIGGLILLAQVGYAQLSLQLDPVTVKLGQSLRLIITTDSPQSGNIPDLTPLKTEFNITATERSSSYSFVNGQSQTSSQWVVLLQPKRAGKIIIPALTMGQDITKPTEINVEQPSTTAALKHVRSPEKISIVTTVDNHQPYIHQQIIYTVKLLAQDSLVSANYQGPNASDALIFALGSSHGTQLNRDNQAYHVEEQTYAIFPQKSGKLQIDPAKLDGIVYNDHPRPVHAQGTAVVLNVNQAPAQYSTWLPAKKVTLSDHYDQSTLVAGNGVTRTLTFEATGMPAQLIPELVFEKKDNMLVYPEQAQDKNVVRDQDIVGSKTIKINYLFTQPGLFVIPALTVDWFNTKTQKKQHTRLPAKTFTIKAKTHQPSVNNLPKIKSSSVLNTNHNSKLSSGIWVFIAAFFALGWLITLLIWWLKPRQFLSAQHVDRFKPTAINNKKRTKFKSDALPPIDPT